MPRIFNAASSVRFPSMDAQAPESRTEVQAYLGVEEALKE